MPPSQVVVFEKLLQRDCTDRLWDVRRKCHSFGNYLAGYSLHSRRIGDPSPGKEWRHLLCLKSDRNLGWSWCDGEHLAVYVHEEDLRNGSFSRIYGYSA